MITQAEINEVFERLRAGDTASIVGFMEAGGPDERFVRGMAWLGMAASAGYVVGPPPATPMTESASVPTRTLDSRLAAIDGRLNDLAARAMTVNVGGPEVSVTTQNQPFETEIIRDKDGEMVKTIQRPSPISNDDETAPLKVKEFARKLRGVAA